MTDPEAHEGGCVCGAVRYRTRGKPAIAAVCHCAFCRKRTGSAFAVITYFDEKNVEILRGELSKYEHRSDESGRWLRMSFCLKCGTTVTHTVEARPGMRGIAGGTFDEPDWFRIGRHIWLRSKRPWVAVPPDVETFPQGALAATVVGGSGAGKS
jgi:hypothetical protein